MANEIVMINRAPVLTLWAAVVAERIGFEHETALTLGKALAGMNAHVKGRRLGIFKASDHTPGAPKKKARAGEDVSIELLGRPVLATKTEHGLRAVEKDKPIDAAGVERYLAEHFGASLECVRIAMTELATSFTPKELGHNAFALYSRFRPSVPEGMRGWGAKGELRMATIKGLAKT
jgi:hypothetical protein